MSQVPSEKNLMENKDAQLSAADWGADQTVGS
jgi:hypothetical protein